MPSPSNHRPDGSDRSGGDLSGAVCIYRVITLWQPWASLAVEGVKRFETRPRPFPAKTLGTRVAFHAALRPVSARELGEELHAICLDTFGCAYNHSLPRGVVVGTVGVVDNVSTDVRAPLVSAEDIACGDWRPGRWSIGLADPIAFSRPVPAIGKQGWGSVWIDPSAFPLQTPAEIPTG